MVRRRNILSRLENQIRRAPPQWTVQRYMNTLYADSALRGLSASRVRNPIGALRSVRRNQYGNSRRLALAAIRSPLFRARTRAILRRVS